MNWLREMIGYVDMKLIWFVLLYQLIVILSVVLNCSVDIGVLENVVSVEWEECISDVYFIVVEYWCVYMIVRCIVLIYVYYVLRSVKIVVSIVIVIRNVESCVFCVKINVCGSVVIINVLNCVVSCVIG